MSKAINNIAVLVSGGGTNLQSIIDNIHFGSCNANIKCVVSNVANVYALERTEKANIPSHVVAHGNYKNRQDFENALIQILEKHSVNTVILAGFMRILESTFINHYPGRILNIHPSLLPKYPGLNTHQKAIENHDQTHGCSVHFATTELDDGPVILQASVPVLESDNAETLAKRVLEKEHIIYPMCVHWLCEGTIHHKNGVVYFNEQTLHSALQLEQIT